MAQLNLGVVGVAGRMGQSLVREIVGTEGVRLVAASEHENHPSLGLDVGVASGLNSLKIEITDNAREVFGLADCVLEFSAPKASVMHAEIAAAEGVCHVIGTTGLDSKERESLLSAASGAAIFWAANMSIGVNVLLGLAERAAAMLNDDFDIEILEMHHRHKADAPSGTALALGNAVARGRNVDLDAVSQRARDGMTGERRRGDIGFAVMRGGDVVGTHSVILAGQNERLELNHHATSRQIFATGAVRAGMWLYGKPAGLYGMQDMLGLSE